MKKQLRFTICFALLLFVLASINTHSANAYQTRSKQNKRGTKKSTLVLTKADSLKKCLEARSVEELVATIVDTIGMVHGEPDLHIMTMVVDGKHLTCPPYGLTSDEHRQKMYVKKARFRTPQHYTRIHLSDCFGAPNDMPEGWHEGMPVEVIAYAVKVFLNNNGEGCNCSKSSVNYNQSTDEWADTRIYLTLKCEEFSDTSSYLLGEVSPRIKMMQSLQHNDYSTTSLEDQFQGQWVRVRGYLFYDCEHDDESTNNGARKKVGGTKTNRLTGWEIHPITSVQPADPVCK